MLTIISTVHTHTHPHLQASITDFTKVGGLQATEERLIAVQDYEANLDELDRLAETYRVSVWPHSCRGRWFTGCVTVSL